MARTKATPIRAALLATTLALAVAACGRKDAPDRPPEAGDTAVARIDGKPVWASDVKREATAQGLIGEGEPLDVSSDLFHQVLDEVVDQKLLAAEAVKRKLDEDPAARRRIDAARERILGDMLVEQVVAKAVTETAVKGLYDEQLRLSKQSDELRARQILLTSQADGESVKKLLASGAAFDALAMERSQDAATRFNGGDLGYFTMDVMPDAYGAALKDAKAGDIVGPFKTDDGWAVVKVEDRRPEKPITLEAARPQIVRFLTYDQVRDTLERLRGGAKVDILIPPAKSPPGAKEPASAPAAQPAPQSKSSPAKP